MKTIKPNADTCERDELAANSSKATYVENRTVYQAQDRCEPKDSADGLAGGPTGVSKSNCNLTTFTPQGYYTSVTFKDTATITFDGCGTLKSPFVPSINIDVIAQQLGIDVGQTYDACGFKFTKGVMTSFVRPIVRLKSSDNSVTISNNGTPDEKCCVDIKTNTTFPCLQFFESAITDGGQWSWSIADGKPNDVITARVIQNGAVLATKVTTLSDQGDGSDGGIIAGADFRGTVVYIELSSSSNCALLQKQAAVPYSFPAAPAPGGV